MHYPTHLSNQNPALQGKERPPRAKAPETGAFATSRAAKIFRLAGYAERVTDEAPAVRTTWTIAMMAGRRRVRS